MKRTGIAVALVCLLVCGLSAQQTTEKKADSIKFDMSYLEKTWGLKHKSHTAIPISQRVGPRNGIIMLLEFTKDVDNVQELRQAFSPAPRPYRADTKIPLWFYIFDEDSVVLWKTAPTRIEGEVTGKKGDAFRVTVEFDEKQFQRARKIEARPGEIPKVILPK